MNKVERLLAVARWWKPDGQWICDHWGKVYSYYHGSFDLTDRKCRQDVEMKLRESGWKIFERKRQGKTVWEAKRNGEFAESPSYLTLVYALVGKVGK